MDSEFGSFSVIVSLLMSVNSLVDGGDSVELGVSSLGVGLVEIDSEVGLLDALSLLLEAVDSVDSG